MRSLLFGIAAIAGSAASAEPLTLKPLVDARLRYERIDQDGFDSPADAVTLRIRPGVQVAAGHWSALVEAEGTLALVEDYNSGTNGRTRYPLLLDPQNVELNRVQVRYDDGHGLAATAGRQVIELADERFVGSASFRQNQQSFDAVRLRRSVAKGPVFDISFAWSNRTINGVDGQGARPQAIGGSNVFAILGYATPLGTLTGFAYLVDQDEAQVQGYRLSSQTYGVRFAGGAALNKSVRLSYVASFARQGDYRRNPNHYAADYWLGEATFAAHALSVTGGYEVLGADRGLALTSVQTPLGATFKFQSWAGKFTTTPPDGVRDLYATIGGNWKNVGPASALRLSGTYHRFDSDRLNQHYGREIDLFASARRGRTTVSVRLAHYEADVFATDTNKLWLSLDWTL